MLWEYIEEKIYKLIIFVFFIIFVFNNAAFAQNKLNNNKNNKGIKITADKLVSQKLDSKSDTDSIEFQGNVKVIKDDTIIYSDLLKIFYNSKNDTKNNSSNKESIKKIIASGNVTIHFKENIAYTQMAEYTLSNKTIVLTGETTKVVSGKNTISGDLITIDLVKEDIKVESKGSKQVEAFIFDEFKN